ncbi:MAG: indole-3-glycerol phosphate synthase TrpC [Armatimonadota bacterium]|jgi:indole-3-glycerol phosphate synthase
MILDDIVARKEQELLAKKERFSADRLEEIAASMEPPRDFGAALRGPSPSASIQIIAEIKRASPSAGVLRQDFAPKDIARTYAENGAAALSVLTDEDFFGGQDAYVAAAGGACGLPVLRKEFIIDEYQIYESRVLAADAVLLLVRLLTQGELQEMLSLTHELGMEALVEAHDAEEAGRAVAVGAGVIGINNRDLTTFETNLETTVRLRELVPAEATLVAESGIHSRSDLERLAKAHVHAALIGTAIMQADDMGAKLRDFVGVPLQSAPSSAT